MTEFEGFVEDGWGRVADAFVRNFDEHGDVGASVAVFHDGRPVVDIWGGVADPATGAPWRQDTIASTMSTAKGPSCLCALMLVDRGEIDLDAPVAKYWPEFRAEGKDGILVRWLLAHLAGLPAFDSPPSMSLEEACAYFPVVHALEAQKPLWEPGTQHMIHGTTQGFLVGELVRRVTGKRIGEFLASEVSEPLGLSLWCGLPESEEPRVSLLLEDPAMSQMMETGMPTGSLAWRALTLNGSIPAKLIGGETGGLNSRLARASEWPACGMVNDARSIAKFYAAIVGEVDGVRLLSPELLDETIVDYWLGTEPFNPWPGYVHIPFGLGFALANPEMPGSGPMSFGVNGGGGFASFGDPEHNLALGYVMNQMKGYMGPDPRRLGLMEAVQNTLR